MGFADWLAPSVRDASATANVATPATHDEEDSTGPLGSVATVARLAVANSPGVMSARWMLHFCDGSAVQYTFDPPVRASAVSAARPTATAVEPIAAPMLGEVSHTVAWMFDECVEAGLYSEEERPVTRAMYACDAAATTALIETMHARIGRCERCVHLSRPGLADGYCSVRDDLPISYGAMRVPPADRGASCDRFEEGK